MYTIEIKLKRGMFTQDKFSVEFAGMLEAATAMRVTQEALSAESIKVVRASTGERVSMEEVKRYLGSPVNVFSSSKEAVQLVNAMEQAVALADVEEAAKDNPNVKVHNVEGHEIVEYLTPIKNPESAIRWAKIEGNTLIDVDGPPHKESTLQRLQAKRVFSEDAVKPAHTSKGMLKAGKVALVIFECPMCGKIHSKKTSVGDGIVCMECNHSFRVPDAWQVMAGCGACGNNHNLFMQETLVKSYGKHSLTCFKCKTPIMLKWNIDASYYETLEEVESVY